METKDWIKIILEFIKAVLLLLAGGSGAVALFG